VDHLRPPKEDAGGVGEQSENIQIAPACNKFADGFGLLFDVGQR
jgi:hypothetical protein